MGQIKTESQNIVIINRSWNVDTKRRRFPEALSVILTVSLIIAFYLSSHLIALSKSSFFARTCRFLAKKC